MKNRLLKIGLGGFFLPLLIAGAFFRMAQATQWPASPLPAGWTVSNGTITTITGQTSAHIVNFNLDTTNMEAMWPQGTHWLRTITITAQTLGSSCSGTLYSGIPSYLNSPTQYTIAGGTTWGNYTFDMFVPGSDIFLQSYTGNNINFYRFLLNWTAPVGCDIQIQTYTFSDGTHTATDQGLLTLQYDTSDFSGSLALQNHLEWQAPMFQAGLSTPDFRNWSLCAYINDGASGGGAGYDLYVAYGTSTPYSHLDSSNSQLGGSIPIYKLPVGDCSSFSKTSDLAPGTYSAIGGLYRNTGAFIASSTTLNFTITTGTPVNYPGLTEKNKLLIECDFKIASTTSDSVNWTVNGIINGLCQVGSFLVIPSQTSLDNFSLVWDGVKQKPPFGYFSQTANEMVQISATSTATATPTSTLPNIAALNIIILPLDAGFGLLCFVSFTFYLWHRNRKIEF